MATVFPSLTAIEYSSKSNTYAWSRADGTFRRITLFEGKAGRLRGTARLIAEMRRLGRGDYFLCHYEWPEVFAAAWFLRLTGSRVFAMIDSKFDDKPRRVWFEMLKSLMFAPYHGALVGSARTAEYLSFLGMRKRPIEGDYDTISIERIRQLANIEPSPGGAPYAERDFVCVARLVPKKNHRTLLAAYARYRQLALQPRDLHLCGNGPEQERLEAQARELGIAEHVHFHGFVQTEGVAQRLGRSLALILPSTEEQFGQVVLEAQAMGLPVIVSDNVGARDKHVRTGVNGFVVEPTNTEGIARYMAMLSDNEPLWRGMSQAALETAPSGDVANFVGSVQRLRKSDAKRQISPSAEKSPAEQMHIS
jgi:glycosyltransferase involved in cell wall biosynthesis